MDEIEYFYHCPYCGENISMLIDLNFNNQLYTEDCEVCCRPIEISYSVDDHQVTNLQIERAQ